MKLSVTIRMIIDHLEGSRIPCIAFKCNHGISVHKAITNTIQRKIDALNGIKISMIHLENQDYSRTNNKHNIVNGKSLISV